MKTTAQNMGAGVALAIILVWLLELVLPDPVPGEVAAAFGVVLSDVIRFFRNRWGESHANDAQLDLDFDSDR